MIRVGQLYTKNKTVATPNRFEVPSVPLQERRVKRLIGLCGAPALSLSLYLSLSSQLSFKLLQLGDTDLFLRQQVAAGGVVVSWARGRAAVRGGAHERGRARLRDAAPGCVAGREMTAHYLGATSEKKLAESASIRAIEARVDDRVQTAVQVLEPLGPVEDLNPNRAFRAQRDSEHSHEERTPTNEEHTDHHCYRLGRLDVGRVVTADPLRLVAGHEVNPRIHDQHDDQRQEEANDRHEVHVARFGPVRGIDGPKASHDGRVRPDDADKAERAPRCHDLRVREWRGDRELAVEADRCQVDDGRSSA